VGDAIGISSSNPWIGVTHMAILDSRGRLFGKVNVLDFGAILVVMLALAGVFLGTAGSVAQPGVEIHPIEVDVVVRGLSVADPNGLLNLLKTEKTADVIIRNQPYGKITIDMARITPRTLAVPQPNGSVKALPDPRPAMELSTDFYMTLSQPDAQVKDGEVILGNTKVKVGTLIELEGKTYRFNSSVVDVRVKK
jgi:hypothetical protein